ncbi:MAG: hypothetical protein HYR63_03810 [Proteobacteria bacterium]|nr:hypothetical protein [Pseudomonadota bacterium]MBI3498585.1 hypothetical protein [Pseudomonadota bacterium]
MNVNGGLSFLGNSMPNAAASAPDKTPVIGSLFVGFLGSLCCGGGLVFGAIGLGAFYSALQIARYIPEALAGSAVLILLLNWLYYRHRAVSLLAGHANCDCSSLRRAALWSGFMGLVMMALSFVFLEWLNHGVIHAGHFMHDPSYASAMIPGVPNVHLGYLALTYLALPVLAILPFPRNPERSSLEGAQ